MNKVLVSILLSLIVAPVSAQSQEDMPRLVVGITIDQLRSDYLYALQHLFSEKGFKLIMQEGLVCDEVLYDFPYLDRAVSTAAIHTGTIPFYNGVVSEEVFDKFNRKDKSILYDEKVTGNGTTQKLSARSLLVSTLSDEVKIVGNGLGRVYSIASDASTAILSAGHIANSALWIDDETGRWATTSYYSDAPAFVLHPYYKHSPSNTIATLSWSPMYPSDLYTAIPYQVPPYRFTHTISPKEYNRFSIYKTTPMVNDVVTDVSIEILSSALLGRRDQLDMITIGYTLAPYNHGTVQKYALEIQDAYVRLDADLTRLFEAIDSTVGLDKTVIYITSTGYFTGEGREPSFYKIQSGEFYPKRAVSLLNMYLMAIYGHGEWVSGYSHNQIYLNRQFIKDCNIELEEVRDKAAQLLIEMDGVQDVYTQHRILLRSTNEHTDRLRRGLSSTHSGDIFIELVPGWEIVYENQANTREYIRHNAVPAPFMLMAPNVKAQKIETPIDVTTIAPTVSRVLRIRAPNGCTSRALKIEYK